MKFKNLFAMWEDAYRQNALPLEWFVWECFRAWAIESGYKAEYGYDGEFCPESCLAAMPGAGGDNKPTEQKPSRKKRDASGKAKEATENGEASINDARQDAGLPHLDDEGAEKLLAKKGGASDAG